MMNLSITSVVWILWTFIRFAISAGAINVIKWNKRTNKFEPINGSSTYEMERKEISIKGHRQENYNYNGQPLTISFVEDNGFFHFYDNDTKAKGIFGHIFKALSQYLNFTIVLSNEGTRTAEGRSLANGTYTGLLEDARLNQTDIIPKLRVYRTRTNAVRFTPAFWMNGQRIYAPANWKLPEDWMFDIFSLETWNVIVFIVFMFGNVNLIIQRILIRYRYPKLRSLSYGDHIFAMSSTLCNQASALEIISNRCRILTFTISWFCALILMFYNAHLIRFMTKKHPNAPYRDLDELYKNTELTVIVLINSFAHAIFYGLDDTPVFAKLRKANRFGIRHTVDALFNVGCTDPDKYVILYAEDAMETILNKPCGLMPVGDTSYGTLPIASGISNRVENRRSFDIGVLKMLEFGLVNRIKKSYMNSLRKETTETQAIGPNAIDINGTSIIFGVLCLGAFVSIVICVVENIINILKKRKTARILARRFPNVKRYPYGRNINRRTYYKRKL